MLEKQEDERCAQSRDARDVEQAGRAALAGELPLGHGSRYNLPSPPLWGRAGVGGITNSTVRGLPLCLTFPYKGGGNAPKAG
jgi:hypothetical protein